MIWILGSFSSRDTLTLTLPGPSAGVSGSLDSYCSLKPLCSGMGEVVPARTSPTLLPHPLALCCHYPVSKCRSASIVVTGTLRVKCKAVNKHINKTYVHNKFLWANKCIQILILIAFCKRTSAGGQRRSRIYFYYCWLWYGFEVLFLYCGPDCTSCHPIWIALAGQLG